MKKSTRLGLVLALTATLPLYQNFSGFRLETLDLAKLQLPGAVTATQVKPAAQSYREQIIDAGRYGLVRTETLSILPDPALAPPAHGGKTDADDRALGLSYSAFLSRTIADVQKSDLFVITAVVELTHQPPTSDRSTAHMASYVDCNNKAASPVAQKSFKRYAGNHHGSMNYTGVCLVDTVPAGGVTVRLLAKSSQPNGVLHGGFQTKLVINQYRLLNGAQDYLSAFFPVSTFGQVGESRTQTSPKGVIEYKPYQNITVPVLAGDLLYLNTQVTASDANVEIPMFGFDLLVGASRLVTATENVVAAELPQVSQTLSAMWRSPSKGSVVVGTRVSAAESIGTARLSFLGSLSKLEGMVLRKGAGADRKSLKQLTQISPEADATVTANAVQTSIVGTRSVEFDAPGILRVKAMANLQYSATDLQTCQTRIQIVSPSGVKSLSIPSTRMFRSPYTHNPLSAELLYNVKDPGTYAVDAFVLCERSASRAAVTVLKSGTSTVIEAYEEE